MKRSMKNKVIKLTGTLLVLILTVCLATSCSVNIGRDNFESARERAERLSAEENVDICECTSEQLLALPEAHNEQSGVCSICGLPLLQHVNTEKQEIDGGATDAATEQGGEENNSEVQD